MVCVRKSGLISSATTSHVPACTRPWRRETEKSQWGSDETDLQAGAIEETRPLSETGTDITQEELGRLSEASVWERKYSDLKSDGTKDI